MKILIIGPDPFAAEINIGPQLYIRSLLEGFSIFPEHKIFLLCLRRHGKNEKEEKHGIKIYRIKEPPFLRTILTPLLTKKDIQKIIKEISPDIIDLHFPHKAGVLGGLNIPFVTTVHGIVPEQLKHGVVPRYKAALFPIYRKLWFSGLNAAKCAICLNKYDVNYLRGRVKTKTVTMAVPRSRRYFTDKHEERNMVLSVGVLCERKNQLGILKAAKIVKEKIADVKFHIIGAIGGEGSIKYKAKLLDYVTKNNLEENVRLIIGMKNDEVIKQYRNAAVYVQFSTQESFPSVIVEAFAAGTPVIASNIPGTNEAVINGKTGYLVALDDVTMLAEKIIYLLQNDALRRKMGENAREYAKKNFLSESIAKQRINLYKEILSIQKS